MMFVRCIVTQQSADGLTQCIYEQGHTRNHQFDLVKNSVVEAPKPEDDKVTFTSGAQSSGLMPPYHLIPFDDCLPRLAARYQLGRDKGYALDNWRKGLTDDAYVADRLNHGLQHFMNAIAKITRGDYTNGNDDDLAGAMWAIVFGMAAQKVRNK